MATWTQEKRDKLPLEDFGDPGKRAYPVADQDDVDSAAHLIGKADNPEKVKRRIIAIAKRKGLKVPDAWKQDDAKMAACFSGDGPAVVASFDLSPQGSYLDGDYRVYPNSFLFRSGEYKDKNISVTPAELSGAVIECEPLDLNLEHDRTGAKAAVIGMCGLVRSAWTDPHDPTVARGDVAVPVRLDDQLEKRGVSMEIHKDTKRFVGAALTYTPRVSEAALMSDLVQFAGTRHDTPVGQSAIQQIHDHAASLGAVCKRGNVNMASRHEADALQNIHDVAVQHGANCHSTANKGGIMPYFTNAAQRGREDSKPMSTWEKIKAALSGAGVPVDDDDNANMSTADAGTGKPAGQPAAPAAPVEDPRIAQMAATLVTMKRQTWAAQAEAFIESVKDKITPTERPALLALFCRAAEDDDATPAVVTFSVADKEAKLSRLDTLKALYAARPIHGLRQEVIKDAELVALMSTGKQDDTKEPPVTAASIYAARAKAASGNGRE